MKATTDSFHLAAVRVRERAIRRFPHLANTLLVVDIKYRWYWRGETWIPRQRFGKERVTS